MGPRRDERDDLLSRWLYWMFDVGWLAAQLFAATREGGRFLMGNT
jgi:hypothetical protein